MLLLAAVSVVALAGCSGPGDRDTLSVQACRTLILRVEGTSERVVGAEDLAVDTETGLVYVSAYDRRLVARQVRGGQPQLTQGGIYELALDTLNQQGPGPLELAVSDLTRDFKRGSDLHPHGIDLWSGADGSKSLFVINRAYRRNGRRWVLNPQIEVFDLRDGKLVPRGAGGTLTDPQMCRPNDLVAVGPRRLFVTNDHGNCAGWPSLLEDALGLARSYVLYYDGHRFRRVAGGIDFANGIALGPPGVASRDRLYVAATRGRGVLVYDVARLLHAQAPARRPRAVVPVGPGVDNLQWGEDGKLYVTAHASLWRFALYRRGLAATSPVRLQRIDPDLPPERSVTQLVGPGPWLVGSTVAALAGGHLLLGAAFADHMMVCDMAARRGGL